MCSTLNKAAGAPGLDVYEIIAGTLWKEGQNPLESVGKAKDIGVLDDEED